MLEQFGETLGKVGQLATAFQTALHQESDLAREEHADFFNALAGVVKSCEAHKASLDAQKAAQAESDRTLKLMIDNLASFGPEADKYFNARTERWANIIGEQPVNQAALDKAA